jgi:type I restriction enzyme S subunit
MATETKTTKAFYNTEIPGDWEVKELGEIAKVTSGGTPSRANKLFWGGDIPWITTSLINFNEIEIAEEFITEEGLKNSSAKLFPKGTLIMALYGQGVTRGKTAILNIDATTNQACTAIILDERKADKKFIFQYLISKYDEIRKLSNTGNQENLNGELVKSIRLNIPPLPEQKAIARVLSTWDNHIHKTEQLITQKELRKKWLMQQLLTGRKSLRGFGGEWKEYKLSDLFDRVTRKNNERDTTVVTISAQRGFVLQTDFFNKNIASEITNDYFLVEKGEFCYNKSYSNGYPWGATKRLNDFDKAVVTTLYICFGVKNEAQTNPEFFEQFFGANLLDKGLTKIAHEGGRAHGLLNVTPFDFFSLKVIIPTFNEQTAIAQVLQAADKEITLLKAKAEKLCEQKKGLMQVLLTGRKRLIY